MEAGTLGLKVAPEGPFHNVRDVNPKAQEVQRPIGLK